MKIKIIFTPASTKYTKNLLEKDFIHWLKINIVMLYLNMHLSGVPQHQNYVSVWNNTHTSQHTENR